MRLREANKGAKAAEAALAQSVETWIAEELARNHMIVIERVRKDFRGVPVTAGAALKRNRKPKR
jgi:hypothetical protein